MIYLFGGSGYAGSADQALIVQRGIRYRDFKRTKVDYHDVGMQTADRRADNPSFLINVAGYIGKTNVDACELYKAERLEGNAVLPGRIVEACAATGVPWGHVSSG